MTKPKMALNKPTTTQSFQFKPFSKKQKQMLSWWLPDSPHKDKDMIIADGSIRSGKTVSMILSFLLWSLSSFKNKQSNFILAGKSMGALKRNVMEPMFQILTAKGITYKYIRNENPHVKVGNNTYYLFGAANDASQDYLQGLTASGCLLDEAALLPKSFVEQAIGRCSVEGSKIWMNCNPNSPYHWLKQDYIDKAKEKNILRIKFQLEDNLTLSKAIIDRYKKMFTGVFYKRYILGDWVMAEGLIYENFNVDTMMVNTLPKIKQFWYGVDYGTSNATAFILVGQCSDGKMYIIDEYYHSNIKSGSQKSPQQYAEELKSFIEKHNVKYEYVFIDPSAEGFILTCYQNGIQRISKAINEVKLGIGIIQSLITGNKFFVHSQCKETLKELSSYSWDPRAQGIGQDKPLKSNDHCLDPIRYVANGTRGIWYNVTKNLLLDNKNYHRL